MANQMPVIRIQGKLTNLTPSAKARRVEGQYGVVYYSDAQLVGPDGKIKVSFGLPEPLDDKFGNQMVELSCFQSEKHGWKGVMTHDEEYKGQTTRKLKVSKTGIILQLLKGAPQQQQAAAAQQNATRNPTPPSGNAEKDFVRKAGRVAFALRTCAKCCDAIAKELGWNEEDARAMANTMFIEMKGTTDFSALPIFDPRQSQPAPPPAAPPEPDPFPSESEFPDEEVDNGDVPF